MGLPPAIERFTMKYLALVSFSFWLMAVGCTANDKTPAGLEGSVNAPPAPAVSADRHPQLESQPDPAANGGSSLPASAAYEGAATITQNVNPAPFLVASGEGSSSQAKLARSPANKPAARRRPASRSRK